ncbi:DUF4136 domain-containing protein [Ekhidna sp.]
MKKARLLLLTIVCACSSVQIFTDYDKEAAFAGYLTFEMGPPSENLPNDPIINDLNGQRIRKAIARQLEARGYRQAPQADLMVNIYVKIEQKTEEVTRYDGPYFPYHSRFWYYGYWGNYYNFWGSGWGYTTVHVRDYDEGTLIVDLVDTKTKRLVWHGVATGTPEKFKKKTEERINEVIERMFDEYPYRAGDGFQN